MLPVLTGQLWCYLYNETGPLQEGAGFFNSCFVCYFAFTPTVTFLKRAGLEAWVMRAI